MTHAITEDRTLRTITIYNPDTKDLTLEDAVQTALKRIDERDEWVYYGFDRIRYNKIKVIFEKL